MCPIYVADCPEPSTHTNATHVPGWIVKSVPFSTSTSFLLGYVKRMLSKRMGPFREAGTALPMPSGMADCRSRSQKTRPPAPTPEGFSCLLPEHEITSRQLHVPFMRPVKNPVRPETDPPTYLPCELVAFPYTSVSVAPESNNWQETHALYIKRLVKSPTVISPLDTRCPPYPSRANIARLPVNPLAPQKMPLI